MKMILTLSVLVACCCTASRESHADAQQGAKERLVLRATVEGRRGERVTCFGIDHPPFLAAVFSEEQGRLAATFEYGDGGIKRFENAGGEFPLVSGDIKRLSIEFVTDGSCEVEVYRMRG